MTTSGVEVYPTLLISFFAIDQRYQKQGWGRALMNVLFEIAYARRKMLGAYTLLTVESVNSALDFYGLFGFENYERPNNRDHTFLGVTIDEIGQFLNSQS
ncbi:GNAT family N-acetyltransferase [Lacticaseibacillus sp. N501-2]|uniref:GNAT family N-acetyltransferase n=1 Tax=Lacticaseibacillus salsurae TaxID=3367729 RepID=UPI0038B246F5